MQGLRPELIVLYKGPLAAPRRTVDVTALTNWLTLQSVERESKNSKPRNAKPSGAKASKRSFARPRASRR